jgi:hypothetical protein
VGELTCPELRIVVWFLQVFIQAGAGAGNPNSFFVSSRNNPAPKTSTTYGGAKPARANYIENLGPFIVSVA